MSFTISKVYKVTKVNEVCAEYDVIDTNIRANSYDDIAKMFANYCDVALENIHLMPFHRMEAHKSTDNGFMSFGAQAE